MRWKPGGSKHPGSRKKAGRKQRLAIHQKAGSLRIDIRSSYDSSDNSHRSVTINTLSGSHKIHAGNILYLDNIELKYE